MDSTTTIVVVAFVGICGWVAAGFYFRKLGVAKERGSPLGSYLLFGPLLPLFARYAEKRGGNVTRREVWGLFGLVIFFLLISAWVVIKG